ncbi:ribosome recycling factor [Candidatus Microgenomates bacterium]|nr:ribosome recycling factor [Candidatus Microgenomates bacterium]
MHPITQEFKQHAQKSVEMLKEDLKTIRTGRATPALVENLPVTTYGGTTTLKLREIATITTEGATLIVIVPFDPATNQDIEKGIMNSAVGLSPASQGTRILVKVPPLDEEQRQKYAKLAGQMVEEKRISVRGNRDDARRKIKQQVDAKTLTEDDKFRLEKEIDDITQKINEEMQSVKEAKEKDIMSV